jgi:hypothetical protein
LVKKESTLSSSGSREEFVAESLLSKLIGDFKEPH